METFRCPDCDRDLAEEDLFCPSCGVYLFDDSDDEQDSEDEDAEGLVEVEPVGSPTLEYKWVLVFAVVLVLAAWAWHALSDHATVLLK